MTMTRVLRPTRGRNITGSRTEPKPQLSDEQWLLFADLFPEPQMTPIGGRPRVEPRSCLEGILWVLRTGARGKDLPPTFTITKYLLEATAGMDCGWNLRTGLVPPPHAVRQT